MRKNIHTEKLTNAYLEDLLKQKCHEPMCTLSDLPVGSNIARGKQFHFTINRVSTSDIVAYDNIHYYRLEQGKFFPLSTQVFMQNPTVSIKMTCLYIIRVFCFSNKVNL